MTNQPSTPPMADSSVQQEQQQTQLPLTAAPEDLQLQKEPLQEPALEVSTQQQQQTGPAVPPQPAQKRKLRQIVDPFDPRPRIIYTNKVAKQTKRYINAGLYVGQAQSVLNATVPDMSSLPDDDDDDDIDGECTLVSCLTPFVLTWELKVYP
jgi:hypothetical protein